MPKVIISYRRSDTQWITGRIVDRLERDLGTGAVFIDFDSIPLGTDFRDHLRKVLDQCDVLLAVIGPKWLAADENGKSRILERTDWVRIEIETALAQGTPVIPVLIDGARMPKVTELPKSMREFTFRQAADVDSGRDFHAHMDRLVRSIARPAAASPLIAGLAYSPSHAPAIDETSEVPSKETVPGRVAELVTAEETADYESEIKRARSLLRFSFIPIIFGVSLWVLSHLDWLPWGLAWLRAGADDRGYRIAFLMIAGMGVGGAIWSYLDLRALRLGTERAIKNANAAKAIAKWLASLGVAGFALLLLLLVGLVIGHWVIGRGEQFPTIAVHWLLMMLTILYAIPACNLIASRAKTPELVLALIGFSVLLTGHLATALYELRVLLDRETPWQAAAMISLISVGIAAFLVWGIAILARGLGRHQS